MDRQELAALIRTLELEIESFPPNVIPEEFQARSYVSGYNNGARRGLLVAVSRLRELQFKQAVA